MESDFPVPWKQVRSKFTSLFVKEIIINKIKKLLGTCKNCRLYLLIDNVLIYLGKFNSIILLLNMAYNRKENIS